MADRTRELKVGIHEVVIRVRRGDGGTDLAVEAPTCACDAVPDPELLVALIEALEEVVYSFGGRAGGPPGQPGDLAPTQPPGIA